MLGLVKSIALVAALVPLAAAESMVLLDSSHVAVVGVELLVWMQSYHTNKTIHSSMAASTTRKAGLEVYDIALRRLKLGPVWVVGVVRLFDMDELGDQFAVKVQQHKYWNLRLARYSHVLVAGEGEVPSWRKKCESSCPRRNVSCCWRVLMLWQRDRNTQSEPRKRHKEEIPLSGGRELTLEEKRVHLIEWRKRTQC